MRVHAQSSLEVRSTHTPLTSRKLHSHYARTQLQIRLHDETRAENGKVVLADYLPPESELAELAAACARAANENSTNIKK